MAPDGMTTKKYQQVDDNLRRVYKQMLDEELPDRFHDLLSQLRDKESSQTGDGKEPKE